MGLLSSLFSKATASWSRSIKLSTLYAASGGHADKGIALDRFQAIVDAHASVEDIVEQFGLDEEDCKYQSLDGYPNCYCQAFEEALERATAEAMMLAEMGIEIDPEELIDMDEVREDAYDYAVELADAWYSGDDFIPAEVLDWAWYDLSDHNN